MSNKVYQLDDAGRVIADQVVAEACANAFNTERYTDAEIGDIKDSVNALYRAISRPLPDIYFAPSPFVAVFAYSAAMHADANAFQRVRESKVPSFVWDDAGFVATFELAEKIAQTLWARGQKPRDALKRQKKPTTSYEERVAGLRQFLDSRDETGMSSWYTGDRGPMYAAFMIGGEGAMRAAPDVSNTYQGGSFWAGPAALIEFGKRVGLDKMGYVEPEVFTRYEPWGVLARLTPWRYVLNEACIVIERPLAVKIDGEKRRHSDEGGYLIWPDGSAYYAYRGELAPWPWFKGELPAPAEAVRLPNMEQRRIACEMIGWSNVLSALGAKTIDKNPDPTFGTLLEVDLPDSGLERFLEVFCPTGRTFALKVPNEMETALEANAWTWNMKPEEYKPEVQA